MVIRYPCLPLEELGEMITELGVELAALVKHVHEFIVVAQRLVKLHVELLFRSVSLC